MPSESRTRVEFYLPVRSDIPTYQTTLDWLAEELAMSRGGVTVTTPFTGLFTSAGRAELITDAIRIVFCDFELDLEKPAHMKELIDYLETTKLFLMAELEEEEIWVIFYPIGRILS